jgi:hypothetical protein
MGSSWCVRGWKAEELSGIEKNESTGGKRDPTEFRAWREGECHVTHSSTLVSVQHPPRS